VVVEAEKLSVAVVGYMDEVDNAAGREAVKVGKQNAVEVDLGGSIRSLGREVANYSDFDLHPEVEGVVGQFDSAVGWMACCCPGRSVKRNSVHHRTC